MIFLITIEGKKKRNTKIKKLYILLLGKLLRSAGPELIFPVDSRLQIIPSQVNQNRSVQPQAGSTKWGVFVVHGVRGRINSPKRKFRGGEFDWCPGSAESDRHVPQSAVAWEKIHTEPREVSTKDQKHWERVGRSYLKKCAVRLKVVPKSFTLLLSKKNQN